MTLARIGEILTYPSERVRVAFAYDKTSLFEPSRNVCDTGLNNVGVLYRKALGGRCLVLGLVPKCHDALAGDHFEPPFFVSSSDVAAIDSHRYRAVGQPPLFPVHLRPIEQNRSVGLETSQLRAA